VTFNVSRAEHGCRVEVTADDINQDSAPARGSPSIRSKRPLKAVNASGHLDRKQKRLQFVVTGLNENGDLQRPRPAYYGPEEEFADDVTETERLDGLTRPKQHRDRSPMNGPIYESTEPSTGSPDENAASPTETNEDTIVTATPKTEIETVEAEIETVEAEIEVRTGRLRTLHDTLHKLKTKETMDGSAQAFEGRTVIQNSHTGHGRRKSRSPTKRLSRWSPRENRPFSQPGLPQTEERTSPFGGIYYSVTENQKASNPNGVLSPPETVASPPNESFPAPLLESRRRSPTTLSLPPPPRAPDQPPIRTYSNCPGRLWDGIELQSIECPHPGCEKSFRTHSEFRSVATAVDSQPQAEMLIPSIFSRKHYRRHVRPYGCIYAYCDQRFYNKSDWKRHEEAVHTALEKWKCKVPVATGNHAAVCHTTVYRKHIYMEHLESDHGYRNPRDLEKWAERSHIGGTGHPNFWCGFCADESGGRGRTISVRDWRERYDHIAQHYDSGWDAKDFVHPEPGVRVYRTTGEFQSGMCYPSEDEDDEYKTVGMQATAQSAHRVWFRVSLPYRTEEAC
jgi:hypothetical protein